MAQVEHEEAIICHAHGAGTLLEVACQDPLVQHIHVHAALLPKNTTRVVTSVMLKAATLQPLPRSNLWACMETMRNFAAATMESESGSVDSHKVLKAGTGRDQGSATSAGMESHSTIVHG